MEIGDNFYRVDKRLAFLFLAVILFGTLVFLTHFLLQQENIYYPLSGVVKTYEVQLDSNWVKAAWPTEKPFTEISPSKMNCWDSWHYEMIKDSMYKSTKQCEENFAFYPMFPLVWKVTGLNPLGISIFNWIVFAFGSVLMAYFFRRKLSFTLLLLVLAIPMSVVYMMPMTESIFFLFCAIGMYGIMKEKYPLYFIGFLLAAMTKSSVNILLVAFLLVEIVMAMTNKNDWKTAIWRYFKKILPIIVGVVLVSVFQKIRGADSFLAFFSSQKYWGKFLSLPTLPFSDWSAEGKSITNTFLLLYFLPCVIIIVRDFFGSISFGINTSEHKCKIFAFLGNKYKHSLEISANESGTIFSQYAYTRYLSMLFLAGNIFAALLTQHGCLNSLARYMLCTPFFVFLLYDVMTKDRTNIFMWLYLAIGLVTVLLTLSYYHQSNMVGAWIVMIVSMIAFFHKIFPKWINITLIVVALLLNIYWTAYLFNNFLIDSWIFT